MNWQKIETAPKDGTAILLYEPAEPGKYPKLHEGVRRGELLCMGIGLWHWPDMDLPHWADAFDHDKLMDEPTHWMPLPPPPIDED
jgi:hypothetical protein